MTQRVGEQDPSNNEAKIMIYRQQTIYATLESRHVFVC